METNQYFKEFKAIPHPDGNRIDLTWVWPATDHSSQSRLCFSRATFANKLSESQMTTDDTDRVQTSSANYGYWVRLGDSDTIET